MIFLNKKIQAGIFFVLFIISFIGAVNIFYNDLNIRYGGLKMNADVSINIEGGENVRVFADNKELNSYSLPFLNSYKIFSVENEKAEKITVKFDGKIDNIAVFTGNNHYYYKYSDIEKFEKTKDGGCFLPSNIKYYKNSKYITDKGILNKISVVFLSFFYNFYFYILPLIFLLIFFYILYKEKISILGNFPDWLVILFIILTGFILRISDNGFSLWSDELYVTTIASGIDSPLKNLFGDPGNPPLFFIAAKIPIYFFGTYEPYLRLLPAVFSTLTIFVIYKFLQLNLNKNAGFICAFLFAINLYSILSAKDFRSYSLCIFFAVLCAYYLFKIIKFNKNKDYAIYALVAALMANTHYFQILILTGNFIYGLFKLKNKKARLKFFLANLFAACAFLPYFIITALKKGLLDYGFNRYYPPTFAFLTETFKAFFASGFIAAAVIVLAILLLTPKVRGRLFNFNKENAGILNIYFYSLYIILFTYISSYLFSLIKPVVRDYYFVGTVAFNVILCGLFLLVPWKNLILRVVLTVLFLVSMFGGKLYLERDLTINMLNSLEDILKYSYFDSKGGKSLMLHEGIETTSAYKKYLTGKEQFISYFITDDEYKLFERLKKSHYDTVYIALILPCSPQFISLSEEKYDISFVRTGKGKLIARIVKRK